MKTLDCKRCSKKYEGDQAVARICNPCYKLLEKNGWGEEEIMERYAPEDDEIEPEDDDEVAVSAAETGTLATSCNVAERLKSRN